MDRIIFALGSNLGKREENLSQAIELLTKELQLQNIKKSNLLYNQALLKENAPSEWNLEFINVAISADINIKNFAPQIILEKIKKIEKEIGRKIQNNHKLWAPREIDIDILAISNMVITIDEHLIIPHSAFLERDFFLKTACEIEPDWAYPKEGKYFLVKLKDILKEKIL